MFVSTMSNANMNLKKIAIQSLESSQINLDALYAIAPSCFTKVKGDDGQLTRKVDFDALRELLGGDIADADTETFGFQWVGKQEAKRTAAAPTHNTLRPVMADSVNWDTTENLYIEGDNLEVLKLLQRAYLGKVKMIYIDPPYNTGSDFVYNDNFAMSREEMDEAMGNLDEEGKYTPDWATVFRERDIKHIYCVAETKGAESIAQLHGVELAKIECAARHFEAISQNIHERTV